MFIKKIIIFLFISNVLIAFHSKKIISEPVVGTGEISFFDQENRMDRKVLIWYPVDARCSGITSESPWDLFEVAQNAKPVRSKKKFPLVILSHGWKGNPHQLSWLIRSLVTKGFVVLGIQHLDFINGKLHLNHWKRAQDLTLALDIFTETELAEKCDLDSIGVAGFSLGGTTALLVSGGRLSSQKSLIPPPGYVLQTDFKNIEEALPDLNKEMMAKNWRDERIKSAFVIAPTWSWLFDEESLEDISIPIYLLASEGDKVIVSKYNAGYFARMIPHAVYQEIPGNGGHYIFLSAVSEAARRKIDLENKLSFLFEDEKSVDRSWLQYRTGEEVVRFFN